MGCGSSKPSAETVASLLELAPARPGEQQPLPELERATLIAALRNVATYIKSKKGQITIISVGGAVNTIFLQSRNATHDIDFYNQNLTKKDVELLLKAAKHAQSKDPLLENEWINNHTIIFIPRGSRQHLTEEAIRQNEVIFNEPGLKVLAAPWPYACAAKLDRVSGGSQAGGKPYDLSDAASYLHRHLTISGRSTIKQSEVESWASVYETKLSEPLIRALENEYQRQHQRSAIIMGQ